MRTRFAILSGLLTACVVCLGPGHALPQNADVPDAFRVGPALQNGYSGDRRIQLATFHSLLVVDTNHPRHRVCGPRTLSEIGTLFNTVNRDLFKTNPGESARPVDSRLQVIAGADRSRQTVLTGNQVTKAQIEQAINKIGDRIRLLTNNGQDKTSIMWCLPGSRPKVNSPSKPAVAS